MNIRKGRLLYVIPFLILLFSCIVYSSPDYINYLTKGRADKLYCALSGNCILGNIVVNNISVIGSYFNVTATNIYINSTYIVGLNDTILNVGD